MGDKSGIEWTEATWNPVVGCSILSAGCRGCYAMREAHWLATKLGIDKYAGTTDETKAGPVWNGTVRLHQPHLDQPLRWRRPRRIFVNSMSDLFHDALADEDIDKVFAVMALCPQHSFQLLTKRPERMREYFSNLERRAAESDCSATNYLLSHCIDDAWWQGMGRRVPPNHPWPLPNLWLGVSVENQSAADERIPYLLATPAAVRFLSCEPLLGPVSLTNIDPSGIQRTMKAHGWSAIWKDNGIGRAWIDWVIAGGESGPKARPMHPDWARSLRDQCFVAEVPFLFKQWGEWGSGFDCVEETRTIHPHLLEYFPDVGRTFARVGKKAAGRLLDGVLHDGYPDLT